MADYSTDEVHKRIQDAIPEAIGEIVTSWTLVVETITDAGATATWWMVQRDQPDTTTLGHVTYVDHAIAAQMVRERLH